VGPDNRRLYNAGDFNVEIAYAELLPGDNDVHITSYDAAGGERTVHVIVQYTPNAGPTSYVVDPTSTSNLQDIVQVVDGKWAVTNGVVRPVERGYDRLFAIGDVQHENYEVTMTVTAYSVDAEGYQSPSNGPALGMGLRWTGHGGSNQPRTQFWPTGAFAWYRWTNSTERFELRVNEYANSQYEPRPFVFGSPYVFKARCSTQLDGTTMYRFKYWLQGDLEPVTWGLEVPGDLDDPTAGSILILSHHVDVDFGAISVVPVAPGT
jgi:hypothetical protein